MAEPLLEMVDVAVHFPLGGGLLGRGRQMLRAVDGVSLTLNAGECLGLVGESGSGKTTVGNMLMRARSADAGRVIYRDATSEGGGEEIDVLKLEGAALTAFRPRMQMIFQDPVTSLSPRMTIFDIIREPMIVQGKGSLAEQKDRVGELMRVVGLDPRFLNRYPHSFSGGQRQRIGIARALALAPRLIICDEPVSALDVSVQAQVLNLLKDLQAALGLTFLFISHNLAVVNYMADRIAVMARGRLVELAPRRTLFRAAAHPYTQALLRAVPYADLDRRLDFDGPPLPSVSNPMDWPAPVRPEGPGGKLLPVDLGEGHMVLAAQGASAESIVAGARAA